MKKITKQDLPILIEYSKKSQYNEYNSNITTMVMWDPIYEIFYEIHDHFIMILVNYHHRMGWLMPLCERKYLKEAFKAMEDYSNQHHIAYEIHGMTQEIKDYCESQNISFIYHNNIDAQDYIYDIQMHKTLTGKRMQKRRNHFNAFMKEYEHRFTYRPLCKEDKEEVFVFLEKWKNNHKDPQSIEKEMLGIAQLFEYFDELHLIGGCIYIDQELKAFSICSEISKDMLQMHVEKADASIRGLYVAILKYTLMHVDSNYQYLNREDDLGLESLRQAKTNLHPIYKIKKYIAYKGETHIRLACDEDENEIKKLWKESFIDEDESSTEFYFNYLYDKNQTYLLLHESKILCMMQVRQLPIYKDKKEQTFPFIVGVATNPYYQGCGYMKQLMNHVLSQYSTIFIQAYNWDLYRPFGFSEAYTLIQSHYVKEGNFQGNICHDANHLLHLYQQFVSHKDGWRIRDLHYYTHFFLPYYSKDYEIYANDEAYVVFDGQCAVECIYTSVEGLKKLLNRFDEVDVICDMDFGNGFVRNVMMVKGEFERNHSLFLSEWQ